MTGRHARQHGRDERRGRRRRREQIDDYDAETIRVFTEHNSAVQQERATQFVVRQVVLATVARTRSIRAGIAMTGAIRAQAGRLAARRS